MPPPLTEQKLRVLRALRADPDSTSDALAANLGMPRTTFGRRVSRRALSEPLAELTDQGLVERRGRRYRITAAGRRTLAEQALSG